jgi:hypothetical protein
VRVWEEFPTGPEGIFLKRGSHARLRFGDGFPFVHLVRTPDTQADRLYYAKGYIYPLAASPFVFLFGTNGFLVLHAVLLTLALAAAYAFLRARAASAPAAFAYACVFFFASAAPVYFVWLTPEIFNVTVSLLGLFLWCYKEVAPPFSDAGVGENASRWSRFLRSPASTYAGAILLGVVTFSKPTNIFIIGPVLGLLLLRRRWRELIVTGVIFGVTVMSLFALNVIITGDLNYQGGDRNTFYGGAGTGFPFQTPQSVFVPAPRAPPTPCRGKCWSTATRCSRSSPAT